MGRNQGANKMNEKKLRAVIEEALESDRFIDLIVEAVQVAEMEEKKEKPTLRIKKSGGTWVYSYKGVDGIILDPYYDGTGEIMKEEHALQMVKIALGLFASPTRAKYEKIVKPFSDVNITDEIAKLRPMVTQGEGTAIYKLIAVTLPESGYFPFKVVTRSGNTDGWGECLLATVKDLS